MPFGYVKYNGAFVWDKSTAQMTHALAANKVGRYQNMGRNDHAAHNAQTKYFYYPSGQRGLQEQANTYNSIYFTIC